MRVCWGGGGGGGGDISVLGQIWMFKTKYVAINCYFTIYIKFLHVYYVYTLVVKTLLQFTNGKKLSVKDKSLPKNKMEHYSHEYIRYHSPLFMLQKTSTSNLTLHLPWSNYADIFQFTAISATGTYKNQTFHIYRNPFFQRNNKTVCLEGISFIVASNLT